MLANYGYMDGAGSYFITVDTDKCDSCGKCVPACPQSVFEMGPDDADPMRDEPVAKVAATERKKIKYTCAPCKPYLTSLSGVETAASLDGMKNLPCVAACAAGAITHSW